MAADDTSGARSGPIVLRIKLRYDTVETMVERFAPNVGKSGLFLPTKAIQPIGTQVKFELRIVDDTPVLVGMGKVTAVREPDPERPKAPFGIAIELMRVSREGGEMIKRMLAARRSQGLPMIAIPTPEELDGVVRAATSGESSQVSAPIAAASAASSGPVAKPKPAAVVAPTLAPEPARRKRPQVAELIAQAQSGPVAGVAAVSVPELDEEIDVARAIARARVLAGGDVDAELEALREPVSAPVEISIEAASAELARQLGGAPVARKERVPIAAWAPPPAVQESLQSPVSSLQPEPEPEAEAEAEAEAAPAPIAPDAAVTAVGEPDEKPDVYAAAEVELTTDPSLPVVPRALLIDDDADVGAIEAAYGEDPDEEHLGDEDIEPLDEQEHTQIGDLPVDPAAFQHHAYATVPAAPPDLEERLDQQLAEAEEDVERELEDMQRTAFGVNPFALEQAPAAVDAAESADFSVEEIDDIDVIDEAELEDPDDPPIDPPVAQASELPQFELPDDSAFVDLGQSGEFDAEAAREFDAAMPRRRSEEDLENALEALDVNLDDIAVPRRTFGEPGSGRISQLVAKTQRRLPDDGVFIDFDDDDE